MTTLKAVPDMMMFVQLGATTMFGLTKETILSMQVSSEETMISTVAKATTTLELAMAMMTSGAVQAMTSSEEAVKEI